MKQSAKGGREAIRFLIAVDAGKEAILYETGIEQVGARYMHCPMEPRAGYTMDYFYGLISERMVVHTKAGRGYVVWEKIHERNEPLDCRDYALAALEIANPVLENPEEEMEMQTPQRQAGRRIVSGGIG